MAIKVRWKFSCSVFICVFSAYSLKLADSVHLNDGGGHSKDFTERSIAKHKIYHGRTKRELSNSLDSVEPGGHASDLIVSVDLNGRERVLELTINRDLVGGSYFQKTQRNGSYHVHRPGPEELELCHYQGYVRDAAGSWAAVSTCSGLRGVVYDGEETFFLERGPEDGVSYVYNGKHLNPGRNQSCGFPQSDKHLRLKRDTDAIRGPYNANRQSRYVELLLVVDHEEYKALGDLKVVYQHCKDITNIINALFVPLNIFIALIGVVVWTEKNEIALSTNGDKTLTNFLHYRREVLVKEHPNDNAQLLTRVQFEGGVVGKALKGPICTYEYSGGIFMDHSSVVGLVATTVAHELGHNFGMEHDRPDCECPDDRCIMAPSSSALSPSHWSSCSLEFLAQAFEHGMDYCLRNKPTKLFDSPVCGNGFVEPGEQCDCGLPHRCNNPCCNATTCMLFANASCATGECCDFETCKPKNAGMECRSAEHECDLPEYCTGESEYCPADVFKIDGDSCSHGKAFCYQGKCRSHSDQCQLLWGPSGKNSDTQCYQKNIIGNLHGNCGYNRLNHTYAKCYNENIYCGMVHCIHFNERLEFGMESVSMLAHSFINNGGNITACRTVIVDLGLNEVDPGLAPDGAKCGKDKMCVNQKCMDVGDLKKLTPDSCPNNCSGNGICNSKGHCHCNVGFSPPLCEYPGAGGSTDSGPASDPNMGKRVTIALYIVFLVIFLLSILAFLFIYYTRANVKIWWKKSPTRHTSTPWECKRQSPARGTSVLLPESVGIVDVGIIRDRSPGPKATLLNEKQVAVVTPAKAKINDFQSELFVKGKGFTIKPLKKVGDSPAPGPENHEKSSSVLTPSYVKYEKVNSGPKDGDGSGPNSPRWKNEDGRLRPISPPTLPTVHFTNPRPKGKAAAVARDTSDVVDGPSAVPIQPVRPMISEPVLEGTTAGELIAEGTTIVPTRKAPCVPLANANATYANADAYDTKDLPPVPSDEPKARPPSDSVDEPRKVTKEPKENREYPTLTKIASLMKSASSISRSSSINEKNKAKVKPEIKKLKFDREKLKNIEISNPIPQVDTTGATEKESGATVTRAHSMREPGQAKPNLQSFGSMRVPSGAKRPTSIHVHSRPTSPPPRPPPPKNPTPEYSYDDCLNLLAEKNAPLAHIDEENSPTANIYATIEDSPRLQRKAADGPERKVRFDDNPKSESSSPPDTKKTLNGVPSGSTESMGLLGEIVSEIQARNLDSIYSSGTLKKKKDKDGVTGESSAGYYGNVTSARSETSSTGTSNGYPSPKIGDTSTEPKANNIDVATYKPYSSSLVRNSGPLAYSYKGKVQESKSGSDKDAKSEFLTSGTTRVGQSTDPANTPSSASPFVKSSFTRPSLLGAPALPKLTPLSITSNFPKGKTDETDSNGDDDAAKPEPAKKGVPNGSAPTTKPATAAKPTVQTGHKPTPPRKNSVTDRETGQGHGKAPNRPLPDVPGKPEVISPKPGNQRTNSRENLTAGKGLNGRKPPTEKKPDVLAKPAPKRNLVSGLQSKFEQGAVTGNGNVDGKPRIPPTAAVKPNTAADTKTTIH